MLLTVFLLWLKFSNSLHHWHVMVFPWHAKCDMIYQKCHTFLEHYILKLWHENVITFCITFCVMIILPFTTFLRQSGSRFFFVSFRMLLWLWYCCYGYGMLLWLWYVIMVMWCIIMVIKFYYGYDVLVMVWCFIMVIMVLIFC